MSSDIVIRVENLSKRYTLKHQSGQKSGDGIRHAIQDAASAPLRALKRSLSFKSQVQDPSTSTLDLNSSEDFWALKDVSFEVRRGEVLGIIGRNGAGKSTLLKILSRITEPTGGRIGIKGRIASLLEVGTGFHPELSGRENIYLNGAILGMSRSEVRRKFDEIVAFAEVEKFLDTPVKRYSSGMYVRLAFAVAAHLEPEILIVDEVLAVGDAEFQQKCIGKMQSVAEHGRTVIFVSHNLSAVASLCSSGLILSRGTTVFTGPITNSLEYYARGLKQSEFELPRVSDKKAYVLSFVVITSSGEPSSICDFGKDIYFRTIFRVSEDIRHLDLTIRLEGTDGQYIGSVNASSHKSFPIAFEPGTYTIELSISCTSLAADQLAASVWLHIPMRTLFDLHSQSIHFENVNTNIRDFHASTPTSITGPLLFQAKTLDLLKHENAL